MSVSLLAVLVAAIASMIIGSIWYSPLLFGDVWMKLAKLKFPKEKKAQQSMMLKAYGMGLLISLVTAYVLGHFILLTEATSAAEGAEIGFWIWLGFIATTQLGSVIWEQRSLKLFLIGSSNMLATALVMGVILAVWPS